MKMYLVKHTAIATQDNPNFAGQTAIAYYGKDQTMLVYVGSHAKDVHMEQYTNKYMIREYGYKRECDARRSWIYKNPDEGKYWTVSVEIVSVEI